MSRWRKSYTSTLRRGVVAEFIGSFFLIIAAIASTILPVDVLKPDVALSVFMNAIAVAFVLFAVIEMLGPISGGHFNPAVTMSFLLSKITKKKATCYIGVQIARGFIGVMATHLMFYDTMSCLSSCPKILRHKTCTSQNLSEHSS